MEDLNPIPNTRTNRKTPVLVFVIFFFTALLAGTAIWIGWRLQKEKEVTPEGGEAQTTTTEKECTYFGSGKCFCTEGIKCCNGDPDLGDLCSLCSPDLHCEFKDVEMCPTPGYMRVCDSITSPGCSAQTSGCDCTCSGSQCDNGDIKVYDGDVTDPECGGEAFDYKRNYESVCTGCNNIYTCYICCRNQETTTTTQTTTSTSTSTTTSHTTTTTSTTTTTIPATTTTTSTTSTTTTSTTTSTTTTTTSTSTTTTTSTSTTSTTSTSTTLHTTTTVTSTTLPQQGLFDDATKNILWGIIFVLIGAIVFLTNLAEKTLLFTNVTSSKIVKNLLSIVNKDFKTNYFEEKVLNEKKKKKKSK